MIKPTTKLQRVVLFSLLFFFVMACRTDEGIPAAPSSPSLVNYLKPGDIPNVMQKLRQTISLDAGNDYGANSGSESNIGTIHFDEILQVLDTLNNANYTFKVDDTDDNLFTFTNLIVREWADGILQTPYLMHYKVDSSQIDAFLENKLSMEHFQGTVTQQFIGEGFQWNNGYGVNIEQGYTGDDLSPCPPSVYPIGGGGVNDGTDTGDPGPGDVDISSDVSRCYYDFVLVPCPRQKLLNVSDPQAHGPDTCMEGLGPGTSWIVTKRCFDDPYNNSNLLDNPCPEADGDIGILNDDDALLRLLALEEELKTNPHLLMDIPCHQLEKWLQLAEYFPPESVINKLIDIQNRNPNWPGFPERFDLQQLENAQGNTVNMDYFSVTVTELPEGKTAGQFLDLIRKNINAFVDTDLSNFQPYDSHDTGQDESTLWNSSNPLGAIIHIDIPADDGAVIVSDYSASNWTFSTLTAPGIWIHPVSGNRKFGYTLNPDGSYTFYTRGVDRVTASISELVNMSVVIEGVDVKKLADKLTQTLAFDSADELWKTFQTKIENYVNSNGGFAYKNNPAIFRPDWTKLEKVLIGELAISDLGCN